MSGPALVNSSLPILNAPTAGATCPTRRSAASASGTSSATMIGFRIARVSHDHATEGIPNFPRLDLRPRAARLRPLANPPSHAAITDVFAAIQKTPAAQALARRMESEGVLSLPG